MSTAVLSIPCKNSDFLMQQSQHQASLNNGRRPLSLANFTPAEREVLGSLLAQSCGSRSRNSSGGSNSSASSNSSVPKFTTAPARMISFQEGTTSLNTLLQSRTAPRDIPMSTVNYRKLDRSISEPADRYPMTSPSSPTGKNVNSTRYKTELCRPFEESGFCKYGDKCQFAHGEHELRSLSRHPKYKTELCRTFHTVGFCPYGPRCHFIHNEDERKLSQIIQLKQQQVQVQQQQQHQAQQQQLQAVQQLLAQAQQQVQAQQAALSQPTTPTRSLHSQRPKALDFAASLPPMVRDTLGSTADSPPHSLSGSPTTSPTSMLVDQDWAMLRLAANTPPPQSAPPGFPGFQFHDSAMSLSASPRSDNGVSPMATPLNIQTSADDAIGSLAAGLQAASIQLADRDAMIRDALTSGSGVFMAPSPPSSDDGDNFPESPIDLARGIRLPIFSRIANHDD